MQPSSFTCLKQSLENERSSLSSIRRAVAFLSGEEVFLTPLEEITAILPFSSVKTLPNVSQWLIGMSHFHNEIFALNDLLAFLKGELTPITADARILLLRCEQDYVGLLVAKILRLQPLCPEKIEVAKCNHYQPFVTGVYREAKQAHFVLSCQLIVQHSRFLKVR